MDTTEKPTIASDNLVVPQQTQSPQCYYCNALGDVASINEHMRTDHPEKDPLDHPSTHGYKTTFVAVVNGKCAWCGEDDPSAAHVSSHQFQERPIDPISEGRQPDEKRRANGTFGPGNNANPNGRPKRDWSWKELLERVAEEHAKTKNGPSKLKYKELVARRLFSLSAGGNVTAIKELMNRMDGMPQQGIDLGIAEKNDLSKYLEEADAKD